MGVAGVVARLRCPVCGAALALDGGGRVLGCGHGHRFDVARQGYVNLQDARTAAPSADTAAMVADRADFLAAGHFAPLAERVAGVVRAHCAGRGGLVVECAAGTGYYLGAALDAAPGTVGLALDSSVAAVKRAARAHPRAGAVCWNVWQPWPVADGAAEVVLAVFAPRNPGEFRRVLTPGGLLVVVTPGADHLGELRELVSMLAVDPAKDERLDAALADGFIPVRREELRVPLELSAADVRRVVGMGPNAHHAHGADTVALPERTGVTGSFVLSVFRPR